MEGSPPRILSLVLWPAVITLAVTVLKLVGQLKGWPEWLVGKPEVGSAGVIGIVWLVFVFGLWFGVRLDRAGRGPRSPGKSLLICVVGIAAAIGAMQGALAAGLAFFPSPEQPGEPRGMPYFVGAMLLGCAFVVFAWGRAALVSFVYALFARIPVVIVTWLALHYGWDTHHVKLGDGFTRPPDDQLFAFLAMPQLVFWPILTVMIGTAMACLGALMFGKRRP